MKLSAKDLIKFIDESPSCYHVINNLAEELRNAGFVEIKEVQDFKVERNKKYFTTRNGTSIIAFDIGNVKDDFSFNIVASHSDSPSFKVKPSSALVNQSYSKLSVEGYGGMLCAPWFDRPLSVAGRVILRSKEGLDIKLFNVDRDLLMIPNVAIHMNRQANSGYAYNFATDMQPVLSLGNEGKIEDIIAKELKVNKEDIISHDLFLTNRQKGSIWGANNEFVSSSKLDDLECAYTSLQGFLEGKNSDNINVYCCFDNEEVGSTTRQGANSTFLEDILKRIVLGLNYNEDKLYKALSSSFMVSADNAHAVHPNHPEYSDALNSVYMNKGVVIKFNAAQSYTTDGLSCALFKEICAKANVPTQTFTNRADLRGGGTLGNISSTHVSLLSVDIGLAQLAMHSCYETAGVDDIKYMGEALKAFYSTSIRIDNDKILLK
jgi:aspartyl aminopeptidase